MMAMLVTVMGLAAVFGFSLAAYFFFYRIKAGGPARWLGTLIGGPVMGLLMLGVVMVVLWPPVNFILTAAVLIGAGVLTALVLGGRSSRRANVGVAASDGAAAGNGGEGYEVDVYSDLDLNTSPRP